MRGLRKLFIVLTGLIIFVSISGFPQEYIADYKVSKESVLRTIPEWAVIAAKNNLHIMYCGTSHSSQTADGMRGLMEYKTGDDSLFAVTFNGISVPGNLDIHYRPTSPVNVYSASDLSNDSVDGSGHTSYYHRTIEYLDHTDHADVNVVMWSWCSIEGHNVQIYLNNFAELINMYKAGGSKGRTSSNEVKFVFMTGYARGSNGDTSEPPYIMSPFQNHKRIVDFCRANNYFCLDYWSQDTYHYETDFYKPSESGNDNIQHKAYFDTHDEGIHWFATRDYSSGYIKWPAHCESTPQHITSNRRAYAAWWIWARLAGWDGESKSITISSPNGGESWPLNTQRNITWSAIGISGDAKITLWQSNSMMGTIASAVSAASGNFSWQVGNYIGGTASVGSGYTIKIKEKGTAIADSSNSSFSILSAPSITITTPNGSESLGLGRTSNIAWNSTSVSGNVKITLWQNGSFSGVIASGVSAASGKFSWQVGNYIGGTAPVGSGYKIKIKEQGTAIADFSDTVFSIAVPQLTITSPNGSENWTLGASRSITWNSSGLSGRNVKITLWRNSSFVGIVASSLSADSESFNWQAGNYIGGTSSSGSGYSIKIKEKGTAITDSSDLPFNLSD